MSHPLPLGTQLRCIACFLIGALLGYAAASPSPEERALLARARAEARQQQHHGGTGR